MIDLNKCLVWGCPEPIKYNGEMVRARYIVADTIDIYAKELPKDRAALLRYIGGEIRRGGIPSKKSRAKARKELTVIQQRLEAIA